MQVSVEKCDRAFYGPFLAIGCNGTSGRGPVVSSAKAGDRRDDLVMANMNEPAGLAIERAERDVRRLLAHEDFGDLHLHPGDAVWPPVCPRQHRRDIEDEVPRRLLGPVFSGHRQFLVHRIRSGRPAGTAFTLRSTSMSLAGQRVFDPA